MHQHKVLLQTYIKFLASEIFFSLTGSKKVLFIISRINFGKMTKLSVNVNKIATLRNARGGNMPNVLKVALDCEVFGADGITVHPRPDERHIRYSDVYELRPQLRTEFNIEGYPSDPFINLVLQDVSSRCSGCDHFQCRLGYTYAFRFFKRDNRPI